MHVRAVVVAALLATLGVLLGTSSASATYRISEDRGGQIGHYLQTLSAVRNSGERVVIDGNCLSACTLVLGIVPRDRVCVTPRARLGFHAAWMPDASGRPVTSPVGTQALWDIYPGYVRRWITHRGGLSRHMLFLQGRELASMVPSCDGGGTLVTSRGVHHFSREALRGQRANATSQRR
ncbi:MAG TPA: hypothetical protein VFB45_09390 [Pseudolabrys sp.]|nr:hypothetical protein [Pseudolabrys sp.]